MRGFLLWGLVVAAGGCADFAQAEFETGTSDGTSTSGTGVSGPTSPSTTPPTGVSTDTEKPTEPTEPTDTATTDETDTLDTSGPTRGESSGDPSSDGETDRGGSTTGGPSGSSSSDPTEDSESASESESESESETGACFEFDVEPNDIPGPKTSGDLGTQNCGTSASTAVGTLSTPTDQDWFEYFGNDTCNGSSDLLHTVVPIEGAIEVCLFPTCPGALTSSSCILGAMEMSPAGVHGCCATDIVRMQVGCAQTDDDTARGAIRVRSAGAPVCEDYEFSYQVESP